MVLIVRNFLHITTEQAVVVVNDLMTARMQQFERVVATELPQLAEDFGLDDEQRRALDGWVLMMAGLDGRHPDLPPADPALSRGVVREAFRRRAALIYCGRPSGLGTSAAQLAERVRGLRETAGVG